jgi:hypothetical protein
VLKQIIPTMPARRLHTSMPGRVDSTTIDPPWAMVEQELRTLDGINIDTVTMDFGGRAYMAVTGGEHGRFAVCGYVDGYGSFICASGQPGGPDVDVLTSGDYVRFPSRQVVSLETATLAAKQFHSDGTLCDSLKWDKQN